jgi:hypothetical protein
MPGPPDMATAHEFLQPREHEGQTTYLKCGNGSSGGRLFRKRL